MKKVWRAVKNEWNEYNDGEVLVRELTSNDNHPPNPEYLQRLSELTKDTYSSPSIYVMLNKRLHDLSYLMHVEKTLIVVEFLLKNSDARFIRFMKMQTDYIKRLRGLKYMVAINEFEKIDKAQIVRRRANRIYALLTDDEELEKQRCKAQGKPYVPKSKPPNTGSDKSKKDNTSNDKKKSKQSDEEEEEEQQQQQKQKQKQQQQQQKTNSQKPKQSTDNNQKTQSKSQNQNQNQSQNQPNLFDDFIDFQDTTPSQPVTSDNQDDLISEDWMKEFANMPNSGTGQDGTALFSFDNNDTFDLDDDPFANDKNNNKNKNDDNINNDQKQDNQKEDAEDWMTQLTNMDNILQQQPSSSQDKKVKSQGKTLAQMAQESNSQNQNQSIDSIFGSTSNSTSTSTSTQPNNFNPYVAFIPNQPLAPNYVQPPMNNIFMTSQQQGFQQQGFQQQSFQQQSFQPFAPNNANKQNNNTFDIFSSNQPLNPVPATYSKNQNNDPFSDLGKLK